MSNERQEALKRKVGPEVDSPYARDQKRQAADRERKERARAARPAWREHIREQGLGFGRLVWIVTLAILLAGVIRDVLTFVATQLSK